MAGALALDLGGSYFTFLILSFFICKTGGGDKRVVMGISTYKEIRHCLHAVSQLCVSYGASRHSDGLICIIKTHMTPKLEKNRQFLNG